MRRVGTMRAFVSFSDSLDNGLGDVSEAAVRESTH
ncbi:hypothetical protein J421_5355 (plasmid) [Gemmatirosa kalamazoonensis]|uniref:Uncharacterized protein n=1 Tax=Gemmatirosa kalamazoonensis TaxID=861299 RepID=W0RQ90_9BACT|nr:hypothetical protein J421_5337 [Gemmatirosa kalamazoonensis]AHG92881.1 hypothetical protein J421_5346 [Gemmatirosa kalamazoonensis]AHG92890.1 hypothetical protein J421_5355 [Gemmatirosa kalamazoonensis]